MPAPGPVAVTRWCGHFSSMRSASSGATQDSRTEVDSLSWADVGATSGTARGPPSESPEAGSRDTGCGLVYVERTHGRLRNGYRSGYVGSYRGVGSEGLSWTTAGQLREQRTPSAEGLECAGDRQ
jgi:hypothetical protein